MTANRKRHRLTAADTRARAKTIALLTELVEDCRQREAVAADALRGWCERRIGYELALGLARKSDPMATQGVLTELAERGILP